MSDASRRRAGSFERYYLETIALGEGCGCAEALLRFKDAEAGAGIRLGLLAAFRSLLGKRSRRKAEKGCE